MIELTIDFGDGASRQFAEIPFNDGMTVWDAMAHVQEVSEDITFDTFINRGGARILRSINNTPGRWRLRVNDSDETDAVDGRFIVGGFNMGGVDQLLNLSDGDSVHVTNSSE